MEFHYIAMPHLPVTKQYTACAFTQKIHGLTRMLLNAGHTVYLYGVGYTDIEHSNLEYIPVVSLNDVRNEWGDGDNRFELGYNWEQHEFRHDINKVLSQCSVKFHTRAIEEINKRKQAHHFLLLSQGSYHKPIADAVNLYLTCEPGIGYRGSYCKFRAFESSYIQNFTYGSEHPRQSINGNYYDRVIPNYIDTHDFEFCEKPGKYLAYLGRIIPRKGITTAMKVADHLGKRLLIAGQGSLNDISYKSSNTEHIGCIGIKDRKKFLSHAMVGFLPTIYLEPFGTTSVEFMYSGTPVLTTNFGVFPETIRNGVGGYCCDTLNDFVQNTQQALQLDRHQVHEYAQQFIMSEVSKKFMKWFDELYMLYNSTQDENLLAWHYIAS